MQTLVEIVREISEEAGIHLDRYVDGLCPEYEHFEVSSGYKDLKVQAKALLDRLRQLNREYGDERTEQG